MSDGETTGNLCEKCSALCCRYFALPLDNPSTAREYDDIRWYLCHENVSIFIEKKQWYMGVASRCKNLLADNRCGIYETRPAVCREYSSDNCDYHGGEYNFEKLFTSAEQLEAYAKEKLAEQAERKERRRQARNVKRRSATAIPGDSPENTRRGRKSFDAAAGIDVKPDTHGEKPGPDEIPPRSAVRRISLPLLRH